MPKMEPRRMAKGAKKGRQKTVKSQIPEQLNWVCKKAGLNIFSIKERAIPGIYFLCEKGQVAYVGQSANIKQRVRIHKSHKEKSFDSVYAIRIPLDELNTMETAFIALLRPKYNWSERKGGFVYSDRNAFVKYWEIGERLQNNQKPAEAKR